MQNLQCLAWLIINSLGIKSLMNTRKTILSSLIGIASLVTAPVSADEWEFSLAPLFLWGMSIEGTSAVGPSSGDLDLDFKNDVLENLEAIFTVHFEARQGDLALFAEYQYADLGPETELPSGRKVNVGFKNTIVELGAAYRFSQTVSTDWEVIYGVRYTKQELAIGNLPSPPLPASSLNVDEDWYDGFVGGRVGTKLSENWSFLGRADVGTGGSDFVWNLVGMVDYRFKNWGSVFVGYKILDYDYDNGKSGLDRYVFDAREQGPLAGLNFYW